MNRSAIGTLVLLLVVAAPAAWADDAEKLAMARVRLSTEAAAATGCTRLGHVSDDSVKDLRRKVVRAGGNTAILSFSPQDLSMIYADVFRCATAQSRPPAATVPPDIPAPPPGPPPPPPPR